MFPTTTKRRKKSKYIYDNFMHIKCGIKCDSNHLRPKVKPKLIWAFVLCYLNLKLAWKRNHLLTAPQGASLRFSWASSKRIVNSKIDAVLSQLSLAWRVAGDWELCKRLGLAFALVLVLALLLVLVLVLATPWAICRRVFYAHSRRP